MLQDLPGWLRVAIAGVVVYIFAIILLRLSGKRSTAALNLFDWVMTVTLGSIIGSVIVLKNVTLLQGFVAIALLIGLQHLITILSSQVGYFQKAIKSQPTVLYYEGKLFDDALKKERLSGTEVEAAVRRKGFASMHKVKAVMLETDATLSVIPHTEYSEELITKYLPEEYKSTLTTNYS